MEQGVARSGHVFRLSSILKNWKKVFLVLYQEGRLCYFEDDSKNARAKDAMLISRECLEVHVGSACKHIDPPQNHSKSELFCVVPHHGSTWQFCAFDQDDRIAWQMALEEARGMRSPPLRRTRSVNDLFLPEYAVYSNGGVAPSAGYPGPPPPAGQYAYMPGQYDQRGYYRQPGYGKTT
ncbi:hypothetical protein RvY_06871-2 [Ramazzottius varieornatus]|uniref:PH domain-containing protein n=1 Tax=Ramazzottius varieornatus TaxID=947166 RepID=A0A1D1V9P5_RAMVA|nr:hypothetical protein RvY_06871-2 [Ramazzottius varieornatus]